MATSRRLVAIIFLQQAVRAGRPACCAIEGCRWLLTTSTVLVLYLSRDACSIRSKFHFSSYTITDIELAFINSLGAIFCFHWHFFIARTQSRAVNNLYRTTVVTVRSGTSLVALSASLCNLCSNATMAGSVNKTVPKPSSEVSPKKKKTFAKKVFSKSTYKSANLFGGASTNASTEVAPSTNGSSSTTASPEASRKESQTSATSTSSSSASLLEAKAPEAAVVVAEVEAVTPEKEDVNKAPAAAKEDAKAPAPAPEKEDVKAPEAAVVVAEVEAVTPEKEDVKAPAAEEDVKAPEAAVVVAPPETPEASAAKDEATDAPVAAADDVEVKLKETEAAEENLASISIDAVELSVSAPAPHTPEQPQR